MVFVMLGKRVVQRAKGTYYQHDYDKTTESDESDYKIVAIGEVEVNVHKTKPLTGRTARVEQLKQRVKAKAGKNKRIFVAAENEEGDIIYLFLPHGSIDQGYDEVKETINELRARPDATYSAGNGLTVMTNKNTTITRTERSVNGQPTKFYKFEPDAKFLNKAETYEMTVVKNSQYECASPGFEHGMNRLIRLEQDKHHETEGCVPTAE